jgi:SAM-dependent methyltransferase
MYQLAKKIISGFISKDKLLRHEVFLRKVYSVLFTGSAHICTICKMQLSTFIKTHNNDLICPRCGSLARDRRLLQLLELEFLKQGITVLDFSPSRSIARKMKKFEGINYISTDLSGNFLADHQYDITSLTLADSSLDLIICYHILEHITDDKKAMSELYRVLKHGGTALIQTPFKEGAIYEDFSITHPKEREKHFGQDDHVRFYSVSGLNERLQEAGFSTDIRRFDSDDYKGLSSNETVFVISKV